LPRHTFRFPEAVRRAVKEYVEARVKDVDPRRFKQEPHYCVALVHSLNGIAYEGTAGFIKFESTSFDDRGQGSAESVFGADFAITATISNKLDNIRKAILFQAKLGSIDALLPSDLTGLKEQVTKMRTVTRSPKVMEIVQVGVIRQPRVISGNHVLNDEGYTSVTLGDYMVRRVLTTLNGDTGQRFVNAVQDSLLTQLRVQAFSSL
jgi:hypothetical protein